MTRIRKPGKQRLAALHSLSLRVHDGRPLPFRGKEFLTRHVYLAFGAASYACGVLASQDGSQQRRSSCTTHSLPGSSVASLEPQIFYARLCIVRVTRTGDCPDARVIQGRWSSWASNGVHDWNTAFIPGVVRLSGIPWIITALPSRLTNMGLY